MAYEARADEDKRECLKAMKILFITPYYKPYLGGIERVIERLSSEYQNKGHEVGIVTTKWVFPNDPREPRRHVDDLSEREVLSSGETVYRIDSFPHRALPVYQVPLVWFSPWAFRKIIREFQPDVIQLMNDRWFWGNFWAWWFRGKAQVAFSLSFHELAFGSASNPVLWVLKQFLRVCNGFLTRVVDWVQVITEHEKHLVQAAYFTPAHTLRIIPWGVETEMQTSKSKEQKANSQKHKANVQPPMTILAVGRLSSHKGQPWLADVVHQVSTLQTKKIRLVLVGADDGLGAELKKTYPDTEQFELVVTGAVDDDTLAAWYQKADVFALFPEYEAFGLVFLEAMAYGVPVITHKVGALEEVLRRGTLLTSAYNQAQAKVVLHRMINDDVFREALAKEAIQFAQEFTWSKTANRFLNEYQKGHYAT